VKVGLLCVSDTAAQDPTSDRSLPSLRGVLNQQQGVYSVTEDKIVADESPDLAQTVRQWVNEGVDLILTSGGTGFGTRDTTPEVISPLIDRPAPGLVTAMIASSLAITPLAALSRPVAGLIHRPAGAGTGSLIVTLPGSPKAAKENLEALLKVLPHALELCGGARSRTTQVHQRIERGQDGLAGDGDAHPRRDAGAVNVAKAPAAGDTSAIHNGCHHHHDHHAPRPRSVLSQDPSAAVAARQRHSPWPMISVREAMDRIFEQSAPLKVQTMNVGPDLVGHVLAEDVVSPRNVPSGPSTNIDGYAVRARDPAGVYKVVTEFPTAELAPGYVYRINTGAPLPPGTDACIMVEDTEVFSRDEGTGEETEVKLLAQVEVGENVRKEGSDVRVGEKVLEKGDVLSGVGGEIGTLAFVGKRSVPVHRRPVVAVLSTGNELRDLQDTTSSTPMNPSSHFSGIVDSNRPTLISVLQHLHYEVIDLGICGDTMDETTALLKRGKEQADVVITTGGTSMGVGDLLKPCIERKLGGTVHFGRVAMKPGKPTTFATLPAHPLAPSRTSTLVFALPGNPASALVTFYLFVLPALRKMEGRRSGEWELPRVPVTLTSSVRLDPRAEYQRVCVRSSATGLGAYTTGGQRSSRTVSLAGANGLLELPAVSEERKELGEGETVPCVLIGEIASAARV
ncbi:molybdenum cofactor biosynthesis protein, partial [Rhodotorula sp. JG-1b]